ncbi:unnamed protein product [Haemonchus placei]|uniref:LAM_G_DOMAIN domain-containing protein n=1 Tax=Haemonchus placei TaxID=6290 RepID=A0A0N4X4F4_HAEPC|nr:unnamed protein product [Haemonchus placei]
MVVRNVDTDESDSEGIQGCCDTPSIPYRDRFSGESAVGTSDGLHVTLNLTTPLLNGSLGHVDGEQAAYFNGTTEYTYLSGGTEPVFSSNTSQFSFEFRTSSSNGVIWWESDWYGAEASDFLIIHLRKGRVYAAVNLGKDKLKSVTTNLSVVKGKWHRVVVERHEHRTTVIVDEKVTTIISSPEASRLDTNGLVYIGK